MASIVEPSKVVSDQYRGKKVSLTNGKTLAGLFTILPDGSWQITQADGSQTTINPTDVDDIQDLSRSTMPDGLLDDISARDIADLLHYLTANNPDRYAASDAAGASRE